MRLDPLRETWTVFPPGRLTAPSPNAPPASPATASPFVPEHHSFTSPPLFTAPPGGTEPWRVRVIPNRLPALKVEGNPLRQAAGFYDRMDAVGAHEVIVESRTGAPLETLPLPHLVDVVTAWKNRMLDLRRDPRMRSFFIVKDHGAAAGARVDHGVSQLLTFAVVPSALRQKLQVARAFFETKKRSIFANILQEELSCRERLVYENHGFLVFCPYAARTPFELAIYPKRALADFPQLHDEETQQLADALKNCLTRLQRALGNQPYHLLLTTAPSRTARADHWTTLDQDFRWHVEIIPRLQPVNAAELATGCAWNPVLPEIAAGFLRDVKL